MIVANMPVAVSYLRVSTDRQGASGLGLEAQQQVVAKFIADRGLQLVGEFVEVESGRHSQRPQLAQALALCRQRSALLVVAKLDRLSRSVSFLSELLESDVEFVAADNPHAGKFIIHILAAVAEHERELISARTKAALAAAKSRGVRLGNPRLGDARKSAAAAQASKARAHAGRVLPTIRQIQGAGVWSLQGIATALNARGVATARGGTWHPSTVRALLRREPEDD